MGLKKSFSEDNTICKVTFIVSKEACQNVNTVNIVGDFNCWSSTDTPLEKQEDGSFSVTLNLPVDREFQFRYLFDGCRWENDWKADKYVPAPFSNADNSVVVTKKEF